MIHISFTFGVFSKLYRVIWLYYFWLDYLVKKQFLLLLLLVRLVHVFNTFLEHFSCFVIGLKPNLTDSNRLFRWFKLLLTVFKTIFHPKLAYLGCFQLILSFSCFSIFLAVFGIFWGVLLWTEEILMIFIEPIYRSINWGCLGVFITLLKIPWWRFFATIVNDYYRWKVSS